MCMYIYIYIHLLSFADDVLQCCNAHPGVLCEQGRGQLTKPSRDIGVCILLRCVQKKRVDPPTWLVSFESFSKLLLLTRKAVRAPLVFRPGEHASKRPGTCGNDAESCSFAVGVKFERGREYKTLGTNHHGCGRLGATELWQRRKARVRPGPTPPLKITKNICFS